jgi:small subunit ribosomal protein S17
MAKTAVVMVETRRRHPLYKKTLRYRHNYKAHDENNTCRVGDVVRIEECHPISKTKRWQVVEVISQRSIQGERAAEVSQAQSEDTLKENPQGELSVDYQGEP